MVVTPRDLAFSHPFCTVLDPNVKDLYFRHHWESDQYESGMKRLGEVVRFQFRMPPIYPHHDHWTYSLTSIIYQWQQQ